MKILITNFRFSQYTGTETVCRDLLLGFLARGHQVAIFSPELGPLAEEARSQGAQVVDDLFQLGWTPDILHGHHHAPLMQALVRFPAVPALYLCHDASSAFDDPLIHPRICRYLAVDGRCARRVNATAGLQAAPVSIIPNAVDTNRFLPRGPLPGQPRRALVFSNYASKSTHLGAVRQACRKAGLQLDVMGEQTGTARPNPEDFLGQYDLVFAKARCALEAMAVGCAVIVCDFGSVGPYVTEADFEALRALNFGKGVLTRPLAAKHLLHQLARYDAQDAARVSARARAEATLEAALGEWERIYAGIVAGFDPAAIDPAAEARATIAYLNRWHYQRRVEWEIEKIQRIRQIPMVGKLAVRGMKTAIRRMQPTPINGD